jgi:hypothetical protein
MANITPIQPRPVAHAARWVAGIAAILGGLPTVLLSFDVITWTAEQVGAYGTFLGIVVGAVAMILGVNVESKVTPVESPRDADGIPLVPITQAQPSTIVVEVDDEN